MDVKKRLWRRRTASETEHWSCASRFRHCKGRNSKL